MIITFLTLLPAPETTAEGSGWFRNGAEKF